MTMNISLLPEELRNQQTTNKRFSVYVIVFVMIGMLFVVFLLGLLLNNVYSEANLKSVSEQSRNLKEKIASFQAYSDIRTHADEVLKQFNKASENTPQWRKLLAGLGNALPDNTIITNVFATYSGSTGTIEITGWANSYNDVSKTIELLSKVNGLENIKLIDTVDFEISGKTVKKFNITATISKGDNRIIETGGSQP